MERNHSAYNTIYELKIPQKIKNNYVKLTKNNQIKSTLFHCKAKAALLFQNQRTVGVESVEE